MLPKYMDVFTDPMDIISGILVGGMFISTLKIIREINDDERIYYYYDNSSDNKQN